MKVVRMAAQMVAAVVERGTVEEETVMEGAVMVLAAEVPTETALVAAVMAMVVAATMMEEIEGKRLAALEEAGKRVEVASAVGVAAMAPEAAGRVTANKALAGVVMPVKEAHTAAVEGALEGVWTALEEMETALESLETALEGAAHALVVKVRAAAEWVCSAGSRVAANMPMVQEVVASVEKATV